VFPLNLLFYLMPLQDGYVRLDFLNWYYVAVHFLAAWFAYGFCRELGPGILASVIGGCAFSFGGFLGTAPWLDVFNGAIWTPLVLLYLFRAARGRNRAASAALSGCFLGIAWLSGHHEIPLLVSCAALAVWAYFCRRERALLRYAALSFAITALVSAVQVWPTYEFGQLSQRWVGAASPVNWSDRIPYTIHTIYSLPPKAILETVLPAGATYADTSPFLGGVVSALAALGILARWNDRRARILAVLAALGALYALGAFTPLHGILYAFSPQLAKARIPSRALHLCGFALAPLAALGAHALLTREHPLWTRRVALGVAVFAVAILTGACSAELAGARAEDRLLLTGFCAAGAAIVLFLRGQARLPRAASAFALLALVLVELTNLTPRTFSRRDELKFASALFRDRDIADFLRAQAAPVRVAVEERDLPANFGDWHAIESLQGYVAGVPLNLMRHELHTPRAQQLFAITHYLGRNPRWPDQAEVFAGASGVKVFRNPDPMPRAWSVHESVAVHDEARLRLAIQDPALDFRRTAVVLGGAAPALETCADGDQVRITRHEAGRVTVAAAMACRGMVVLADTWFPGWRLKIDGQPGEMREVYGALRGIVLERGAHQIDMIYRPLSVLGGAAVSLTGLLATALIAIRRRDSVSR
jgi:hypothetical protein